MKILVLYGSPKGDSSNTLKITKAFCEGISESVTVEREIISIQKMNIKDCTGCFGCWSKTPGSCFIKDDMKDIIQKIICSDIIIWSFPLYYYSLPSRIKAVMDRQLPMSLPFMVKDSPSGGHPGRYDTSGKRYIAISTCGFYTSVGNYNAVDEQFSRMYGIDGFTSLYCGEGEIFGVPQHKKRTDEYLELVKQAGREYILGGITPKTNEYLSQPLYPREVFEQMADANWGIKAGKSCNDSQREDVSLF